jgi:F-type H+-transporting ATPase subunit b
VLTFEGFKAKKSYFNEGIKMLDIQLKWLLILAANFFVLLYVLNVILYKPLLKTFDERSNTVKDSLNAAKEMNVRKEEGIAAMNSEIAGARKKAKEIFEGMRGEGLDVQKKLLSEADGRAAGMLQKAREELRSEAEKARQTLRADVEKFSDEIVRKLVKA